MHDPQAILNVRLSVLEQKVDFLLRSLNLRYEHPVPEQLKPIAALLQQGKRKAAIEAYCEATGGDVADAQAAILELELGMR